MNAATLAMRKVDSLRKLDPARVQLTDALLKLLSGEMEIAVTGEVPAIRAFVTDDGLAFAILSATGRCMLADDDSVDHACDVLDAADPVLRHVETRLGIAIEPTAICAAAQTAFNSDNAVIIRIGHEDLALLLAIDPDDEQRARWIAAADAASPDTAAVPVAVNVEFEAAKLSLADAAGIAGGDMLLLPRSAKAVWHDPARNSPGHAIVDLAEMILRPGGAYYDEEESGMNDELGQGANPGFQVPVTVRLPTQYVAATTLAALHAGSSLQLGPLVQGLAVELLVGGRPIATGEIVEVGENFAILIDERMAPPVAAAVTASNETTGEVDLRSLSDDGE